MSKKILLMILILMLSFGVNNVYAQTIDSKYITTNDTNTWSSVNNNWTATLTNNKGLTLLQLPFDTNYSVNGYDKVIFNVYSELYDTTTNNSISISSIDFDTTCTHFKYDINNTSDGYIYYINDPNPTRYTYDEIFYLCDSWESINNNNISGSVDTSIIDLNPTIMVYVGYDNNTRTACENQNGTFVCALKDSGNVNKLYIYFNNGGKSSNYKLRVYRYSTWFSGEINDVIINNNQNQQQNHQDSINTQNKIDDLNNSITDSNVNGNNSNNTISSIGGTFNTENDFLLGLLTIPYTFWTSITNVFSNSCSALNVGTMFDKPLIFPCIELNDYLGNVFTTIIDVIFAGIIMSAFVRRIIRYYQALLSLDNSATIIGGVKVW